MRRSLDLRDSNFSGFPLLPKPLLREVPGRDHSDFQIKDNASPKNYLVFYLLKRVLLQLTSYCLPETRSYIAQAYLKLIVQERMTPDFYSFYLFPVCTTTPRSMSSQRLDSSQALYQLSCISSPSYFFFQYQTDQQKLIPNFYILQIVEAQKHEPISHHV